MVERGTINIELVYIKPNSQNVININVPTATTIDSAIQLSGILKKHPEIDLSINKVGVFNKIKELDYVLAPGDRVEIYRPLIVDPKEARRRRAMKKK